jgi:hypothetical protein
MRSSTGAFPYFAVREDSSESTSQVSGSESAPEHGLGSEEKKKTWKVRCRRLRLEARDGIEPPARALQALPLAISGTAPQQNAQDLVSRIWGSGLI